MLCHDLVLDADALIRKQAEVGVVDGRWTIVGVNGTIVRALLHFMLTVLLI
jgi:hypothetical protein